MIRTQIQFDEDVYRQLKEEARMSDCSISEFVRRSVQTSLTQNEKASNWASSLAVAGKYRSGLGDLAAEHDKHLGDAW